MAELQKCIIMRTVIMHSIRKIRETSTTNTALTFSLSSSLDSLGGVLHCSLSHSNPSRYAAKPCDWYEIVGYFSDEEPCAFILSSCCWLMLSHFRVRDAYNAIAAKIPIVTRIAIQFSSPHIPTISICRCFVNPSITFTLKASLNR